MIIGLGIIELILGAFIVTNPYFQNSEDFEIHEIEDGNRKIINIRYKDYKFELFDRFDIKHLKNVEKNDKHVSIIDRYKIKRYYKYALLNILNKPMDLENVEQYKSARRANDDEILEYREILEKRRKTNIWKDVPGLGVGLITMIILAIIISIAGVINGEDVTLVMFAICATAILSTIITLFLGFTNTFEHYKKKQRKNAKKILKILKEGQVFIVDAKELLHKFSTILESNRRT